MVVVVVVGWWAQLNRRVALCSRVSAAPRSSYGQRDETSPVDVPLPRRFTGRIYLYTFPDLYGLTIAATYKRRWHDDHTNSDSTLDASACHGRFVSQVLTSERQPHSFDGTIRSRNGEHRAPTLVVGLALVLYASSLPNRAE